MDNEGHVIDEHKFRAMRQESTRESFKPGWSALNYRAAVLLADVDRTLRNFRL